MALFEYASIPRISSLSTVYVRCTVSTTEFGLPANPTSGTVSYAFLTDELAQPEAGDWVSGSWETAGTVYYARSPLIGPDGGDIELSPETYSVWVRVVKSPETVIDRAGKLTVY